MSLSKPILRPVVIVLILAFTLSGMPAYAAPDTASDFALAPPLATKPPCQIVQKSDGSFDVVTNNDAIESWGKEAVRSVRQGEALGKAFRNRWAFVDVSYLIGQMLILARDHKLQNPKEILIPLIKKHIRNRAGMAEMLLEGYDIDGIEGMREGGEITGFSLPVKRSGTPAYQLVYNLQGGDTTIPMSDGAKVYVKIETIATKQMIDKSSMADVFPANDYLAYLAYYMAGGLQRLDKEPKDVVKEMVSLRQRLRKGLMEDFARKRKSSSDDVRTCYLWFIQLIRDNLEAAKGLLPLVQYDFHKENMTSGIPDAENFADGIEMLLYESEKEVDINQTLEKILTLTFSEYYRKREYKYAINKQFSSNIPSILARQDEIAYLFFSLVLPLRRTREVTLTASTQLTSDKGRKYVTITITTPQEVSLKNVTTYPNKDTGIGFESAKRIVQKYGGTISVQSEVGKGTTFTLRLPVASEVSSGQAIRLPIANHTPSVDELMNNTWMQIIFARYSKRFAVDYMKQHLLNFLMSNDPVVLQAKKNIESLADDEKEKERLIMEMAEKQVREYERFPDFPKNITLREFLSRETHAEQDIYQEFSVIGEIVKSVPTTRASNSQLKTFEGIYTLLRAIEIDSRQLDDERAKSDLGKDTTSTAQLPTAVSFASERKPSEDLDSLIANPIFDSLYSGGTSDANFKVGPFIRNILYKVFKLELPFRSEILDEVNAVPDDEIIRLAEDAVNREVVSGKVRDANERLTLNDIIKAKSIGVSDKVGPVDFVQYFGNAQAIGILIKAKDNRFYDVTKKKFRDAYIVLRALYCMQSRDSKTPNKGAVHPANERIHATNFQDTLTYIQAQPQSQPLIVALGTSWITGYEKGRYLQYDALNPLIGSIRTYCESKGIPFIVEEDDKLLARINAERAKEGKAGAKVVVLAGKDTVVSDEFATLRNDQDRAFVVGVDSQGLTTDSYIRLMEMLTLAIKLSAGLEVSLDNAHITITRDNERHLYIFLPHAEPMNYEKLKMIYEVQKFA